MVLFTILCNQVQNYRIIQLGKCFKSCQDFALPLPPCGLCGDSLRCVCVSAVFRLSSRCLLFHNGRLLLMSGLPGLFPELSWVMGNSPPWSITPLTPRGVQDRQNQPKKTHQEYKVVTSIQMINDPILYIIFLQSLEQKNTLYSKHSVFHIEISIPCFC